MLGRRPRLRSPCAVAFFASLAIFAASMIVSWLLRPKGTDAGARPVGATDLGIPRANEGAVIPRAFGTVRLRSPIVVRVGDYYTEPLIVDGNTVGFDYFLSMRLVLCQGNAAMADTSGGASLVALFVGDRRCGDVRPGSDIGVDSEHDACVPYYVLDSKLFDDYPDTDGDLDPARDVLGVAFLYRGRWDQVIHSRDFTSTENWGLVHNRNGKVVLSLTGTALMNRALAGDHEAGAGWRIGMTGQLPPYSIALHMPCIVPGYATETGPISTSAGTSDANPAAVAYALLVDDWGGAGQFAARVDAANFAEVGGVLAAEEHGISLKIEQTTKARDAIETVLKQIDGVMFVDPATGLVRLKLIRADYVFGSLFVVDDSVIVGSPTLQQTMLTETVNSVLVSFIDAAKNWNDGTEPAIDAANMNAQGRRNHQDWSFPGCSNRELAQKLATRTLNVLSQPIMRLRFAATRAAGVLRVGDAFRLTYAWEGGAASVDAVFRVMDIDYGTLEDDTIHIDAVQDRFTPATVIFSPPDVVDEETMWPRPISLREVMEMPRWVAQKRYEAGLLANVDAQHGMYFAAPAAPDSGYRVDLDGAGELSTRPFPGTFTLGADYARSAGPYDTTGITIENVRGWMPAAATATQIATEGRNLIAVGGEIMAFESATFVSGTTWTLDNVWRGVLDTVPADHLDGDPGYSWPLPVGNVPMGSSVLVHGVEYEAVTRGVAQSGTTPASESPADTFTARSRVRRPYPVDSLLVLGSQAPATLKDDGVTLAYARRDRLELAIARPDAADETPEAGTTYNAVAIKGGTATTLATGITSGSTVYPLGAAGHGLLEVGVDSALVVALPDGSTPTLGAWQVPTIEVDAPASRNLVVNGLFSNGTSNWTVTVGSASAGSGSGSLGGGGTMVTPAGSVATLTLHQDVPIQGYPPADLRAWLEFAAGPTTGDANDTIAAVLTSRDSGGSVLQTQTLAAVHPAAWDRYELEIANLHADTATIRVQLTMATATSGDGGDTHADIGVTEVRLHVGDFTGQLLSNPEFASGVTSWTESVGTWQVLTATLYGSAQYVRPNDGASAQLRQVITPAAGFERNATVVARFGRMNDGADDTGTVTIQALDGGGAVLASATTGAEALATLNVWARRYLALVLPDGTATIRVQLDAARVTGTPLNACFGDFNLRIHKALDPIVDIDHRLLSPPTQRIPRDRHEWFAAFPAVAAPNVAMLDGQEVGRLGVEPVVETVGAAYTGGSFICDEGRRDGRLRSPCYDLAGGTVRAAAFGQFMNFATAETWCVGVAYKSDGVWSGSDAGLVGRHDGTTGWELGLDSDGTATARLTGASGSAAVSGEALLEPGQVVMRMAFIHHEPGTLSVIDQGGVSSGGAGAVGQIRTTTPTRATIGVTASYNSFAGQISRVWAWRGSSTPTTAEIASLFTYADNATGITDPFPRVGTIATICGSDADGPLLRSWPIGVAPYATREELSGEALISVPEVTNRAVTDFAAWTTVGSAVVATVVDPFAGMRSARSIESASGDGIRSPAMALGGAATLYAKICYVAPDGAATVVLEDTSGATVASQSLAQTAVPLVSEFTMAWSGATSGVGRLRITSANAARTLTVSPVHYLGAVNPGPGVFPFGAAGAACPSITIAPTTLYNAEGELLVEADLNNVADGIVARAWNTSSSNDERRISLVGGSVSSSHGTGAGSLDTATVSGGYDVAALLTARLRWARTGLRDGVASEYSVARVEQGGSIYLESGRAATWTPSTTEVTRLDLGHDDGADAAPIAFGRVRVRAREPRL